MYRVGFRWLDGVAKGIVDLFDQSDLTIQTAGRAIEHDVLTETGRPYGTALCMLTVEDLVVTLNYECFPEENSSRQILLGQIRLEIERTPKFKIVGVEWKSDESSTFSPVRFEYLTRRARQQTSSRLNAGFNAGLQVALTMSNDELSKLLPEPGSKARRVEVTSTEFIRNSFVVAAALRRANGICEMCGKPAPFRSRFKNSPYLEVHHIVRLADGGDDTLDNARAVCPNCHRRAHFGE